jgi:hypothetical protein
MSKAISWREILTFLSPAGQQQIVDFVRQAQTERGANWLPEVKAEFPTFSWLADLVCNYEADEAFDEIQSEFSTLPLSLVKPQLVNLHATLRNEIERKHK